MKSHKNTIRMPRYTHARALKSGNLAYYWQLPTWAKQQGCTIANEALGTNMPKAMVRAEFLNNVFDDWKKGRDTEGKQVAIGTLDWLAFEYESSEKFKKNSPQTQKNDHRLLKLACNHRMKDGSRLGSVRLSSISPGNADRIHARIRDRIEGAATSGEGQPRPKEAQAMIVCLKTAWKRVQRTHRSIVPAENPFVGVDTKYKKQRKHKSSHSLLLQYEAAALDLGYLSIAAIARIQFECYMRPDNIIKYLKWEHYKPGHSLWITHNKNENPVEFLLKDDAGKILFPELEAILARLPRNGDLIISRDLYKGQPAKRYIPYSVREMQKVAAEVRKAAQLPDHITLSTFRHGGIQEGANVAGSDQELLATTKHKSRGMIDTYTDHTAPQRRQLAVKRRAARDK